MKNIPKGFDVVIPVYNEGKNIVKLIEYLSNASKKIINIYICYDFDNDSSIDAIKNSKYFNKQSVVLVKNSSTGPCEAIKNGFFYSKSEAIVVYPADDFDNALLLDKMYDYFLQGYDVVCPSRFMRGGLIKNCPFIKLVIVRIVSFSLYYIARIGTKDPTNGFRLFSKKLLNKVSISSKEGFAYSLELLIKAKKQKLKIIELPSIWIERKDRKSRFKILKWSKAYLKWFFLAFIS